MSCFASCCLRIAPWLIVFPLLVFLLWVEPGDEYVIEEPVDYAYDDQAYVNSENFAGKMTIPSKSLLSLLASCSLFAMPRCISLAISCLPYCHVKPLTHLSSTIVVCLCYRFCSAPLIALLVAGEDEVCSMLEHGYLLGYHYYILFTLMHLYTW